MISNNETVSRQNLWADNISNSMTSEGNSSLLPANVYRWPQLQRGLMNFQLRFRFSGNKINCFPRDQSGFGPWTSWTLSSRSIHFCLFITMFYCFLCLFKVGYVRELYLVPGKVHKMKTLSLRPALFGNQTVLNMNLLSTLEFPPYLKVKVFFPF